MTGAILGDIAGSRFEFSKPSGFNYKKVELFGNNCFFTDDTVLTIATKYALLNDISYAKAYGKFGRMYRDVGYGTMFQRWLDGHAETGYGSFGNGSAMRVSPVAWFAGSLGECERLAAATAEVTHNHPEGIKGAVAVAGAIYLARTGHSMAEIRDYTEQYYHIDFTLDEIRPDYDFVETCQGSVPQALEAFFESTGFEDAIRNAVSIGGDSDTIADMAGAIAEAYYGVDREMKDIALSYLDLDLLDISEEFERRIMRPKMPR